MNDIDSLLELAASTKSRKDVGRLIDALKGQELFLNLTAEMGSDGQQTAVSTPLVEAGPALKAVLLFTSKNNSRLQKPFGGITWEEALKMVATMTSADGLILQGKGSAWIGFDRTKVLAFLESTRLPGSWL